MFSSLFWVDALERAIRTAAQTFLGLVTVGSVVDKTGALDLHGFVTVLAVGAATSGVAGLLSVVSSLAASRSGDTNSASFLLSVRGRARS